MFVSKKHMSRRTVLRGMGVTVALPFLESMLPAMTLARTATVCRQADHLQILQYHLASSLRPFFIPNERISPPEQRVYLVALVWCRITALGIHIALAVNRTCVSPG